MTTKPPTGLAATGHPDSADDDVEDLSEDLSDELVVDSSQDVTVEASDDSTLELDEEEAGTGTETPAPTPAPLFASMETPPPLSTNTMSGFARRAAPTLLGMPLPSMPLPGSSAPAATLAHGLGEDEHEIGEDDDDDEVTVLARPSVTDDEEEATKVEPAETAIRAAALKDDEEEDELTAALSTQASVERERALRKSMPPSLDVPLSAHSYRAGESGAEFASSADLADDNDDVLGDETPGVALDEDESATGTYSPELDEASELEAVLAPRRPTSPAGSSPLGFGGSPFSASAPLARSDGFGGRLPTPSAGLGLTLPPSPTLPPPAASPFASRLAPAGAPYPRTMSPTQTGPIPTLQIPAPSGAVTMASTGGIFRNVQLPLGGLVASCLACLVGGLVIGGKFLGTRAPAPAPMVAAAPAPLPPAAATPPTSPPVVAQQPAAAAPTHAAPPAHVAAAPSPSAPPAPQPSPPAAAPSPTEPAIATGEDAPKPVAKRAARPATVRKVATNTGDAPVSKPRPKVAKGWVDPFAD